MIRLSFLLYKAGRGAVVFYVFYKQNNNNKKALNTVQVTVLLNKPNEMIALRCIQAAVISLMTRLFSQLEVSHFLYLPYAVEHVAVFRDAKQLVVGGDLVEVGPLLVGKEQIRFPDGVQHRRVEVQRVVGVLAVGQPRVVPLLSQEDVHSVVLRGDRKDRRYGDVRDREMHLYRHLFCSCGWTDGWSDI